MSKFEGKDLRIFKNGRKYVNRLIYFPERKIRNGDNVTVIKEKFRLLEECSRSERYEILSHGKSDVVVESKPDQLWIYRNAHMSMIKFGGSYTGAEVLRFSNMAKEHGLVLLPMVNDAHGGGRGARSWGVLTFAYTDLIRERMLNMNVLDEYNKLLPAKRLNRQHKLLGEKEKLEGLTVKIIPDLPEFEGLIFLSKRAIEKYDLPFAVKFACTLKGLGVPVPSMVNYKNVKFSADVNIPVSENKIGIAEDKLPDCLYVNRRLSAEYRFSRNLLNKYSGDKGKNARKAWDYRSILGIDPKADLSVYELFHELGEFDDELLDEMFGYTAKDGSRQLQPVGMKIKGGMYRYDKSIVRDVKKALWTRVCRTLQGKFPGSVYGNIIPMGYAKMMDPKLNVKYGWFTRWPWMDFILCKYAIYRDAICIEDKVMKLFGGDYDGDQGLVVHRSRIKSNLVYHKMRDILEDWMRMPVKEDTGHGISDEIAQMSYVLDQYSKCGQAYNAGKIVEEVARMEGWTPMQIVELRLRITSRIVQPYINGQKYVGGDKPPNVFELCKMFDIPVKHVGRCTRFFNAFRTRRGGLDYIIKLARELKADPNSKSFYERIAARFLTWNIADEEETYDAYVCVEKEVCHEVR